MVINRCLLTGIWILAWVSMPSLANTWVPAGQRILLDQTEQWVMQDGLAIKFSLAKRELFAGEIISIDYQIKTNDAFISIGVDNNGDQRHQYSVLKTRKVVLEKDAKWKYQYAVTILYRTSTAGQQQLLIPALIYSVGGQVLYQINFSAQSINVLSLPVYLPPDILIAAVDVNTSISSQSSWLQPLTTDYLYHWVIKVSGTNLGPGIYNDVMRAVSTDEHFEFMPAEVIDNSRVQDSDIQQQIQYRIPFTVKNNGRTWLPAINLQYFDTATQKLVSIRAPGVSVFALDKSLQWLFVAYITLLLLSVLIVVVIVIRRAWTAYRQLGMSLMQFDKAETPDQERQATHYFSQSLDWPASMGLFQWGRHWQQSVGENAKLSEAIDLLARALYSQHQSPYDHNLTVAIRSVSFLSLYKLFIHRYFVN